MGKGRRAGRRHADRRDRREVASPEDAGDEDGIEGGGPRSGAPAAAPERVSFLVGGAQGEAGERLDRFLAARLAAQGHSRAEVQRWIHERRARLSSRGPGGMRVDRIPEPHTALRAGDQVELAIPPPRVIELRPERIGLPVLHDDETLLVVNKPAGLVSHPSPGHASGTLVNALLYLGGDLSVLSGEDRPGLVHRLDRDTSGVMVIARTDAAHRALCHQFKHRETEKEYVAIVEGAPPRDETSIDAGIARHPYDRQRFAVDPAGRPAQTRVVVERRFQGDRFALVRCFPRTGRTHQIRVHLAHLGTPVLCDPLYGRR
ncbi:MAG TPA: RluA family pseudouridine synthase, partial [Planctomycetota bacterium]|nr:RluA family pseudouridine synthase [Planctomycetota bacterium]